MKKIYFAMAVLATAAMVSCVKEIPENNQLIGLSENGLAFTLGGPATRSADAAPASLRGITIPLGKDVSGTSFYLEETVTDLEAAAPVTRGTPAYTENIGVLYANQLGVYSEQGNFGDTVFENKSESIDASNGRWSYTHNFPSDPWPDGGDGIDVDFYFRMPATQSGVKSALAYEGGKITFRYESPSNAAAMQDILFGYTTLTKSEHKGYLSQGGAPVLLNHALTGVKFAIGNDVVDINNNSIKIDSVRFKGLKDYGKCVITPAPFGSDDYVSAEAAVWDSTGVTVDRYLSSGKYADTVTFQKGGSFGTSGGNYPESFAAAGNVRNLGEATASQTFWLIPQELTAAVKLEISYTFGGAPGTWELDFGSILMAASKSGKIEWKAGQLRTYTIKIDEVNLKIEDNVTKGANGIVGSHKDDILITNTGNTDVFIRAAIVGQWLDEEDNPVFGFTDDINNLFLVESWYEDQFENHNGKHGVFKGLAGYQNDSVNVSFGNPYPERADSSWKYNSSDRYYYYTSPVAPGDTTAARLFESYTIFKIPVARNAGVLLDRDMYFTLEIATQAISARNNDGSLKTDYEAAWRAAEETE